MNPIVSELFKVFVKEIAAAVADHLKADSKDTQPSITTDRTESTFKPECSVERSEAEWRADCLKIISDIAPTHGPQLRKLFPQFDGAKRLPEVKAADLPALLAELVMLKDAE